MHICVYICNRYIDSKISEFVTFLGKKKLNKQFPENSDGLPKDSLNLPCTNDLWYVRRPQYSNPNLPGRIHCLSLVQYTGCTNAPNHRCHKEFRCFLTVVKQILRTVSYLQNPKSQNIHRFDKILLLLIIATGQF